MAHPAESCPYKEHPAYHRSRLVRDPEHAGWLVLYDSKKAVPPGMDKLTFGPENRMVLMWRPLAGATGPSKYKRGPSFDWANAALAGASNGLDVLGIWGGRASGKTGKGPPTRVNPDKSPPKGVEKEAQRTRAHNAREESPPSDEELKKTAASLPKPPSNSGQTREQASDHILLEKVPMEDVVNEFRRLAFESCKVLVVDGTIVDNYPDDTVRMKALDRYWKLLVIDAAQREKEMVARGLEVSDLMEALQTVVGREELRSTCKAILAYCDEFEQTGQLPAALQEVMV